MKQPDIVFINCHDLGRHLSIYDRTGLATPGLERLAAEGVVFDQFFSTSTLCSPSRGSVQTSLFPHQCGLFGLTNTGWDIHPGIQGLPHALAAAGYDTWLFGIQHERQKGKDLGYAHRAAGNWPGRGETYANNVTDQAVAHFASLPPRAERGPQYVNIGFFEPHKHDYYDRYGRSDPAAIQIPPFMPDTPGVREDLARYEGLIMAMDEGVGRILAAIDAAGMTQDTLVLFTTDHGIPFPRAKTSVYDPGLEVTALVRWPGVVKAGMRNGALLSHLDWLPTLLEITGASTPHALEGQSFLPLLTGGEYTERDRLFAEHTFHMKFDPIRCVRTRTHKLIRNFRSRPARYRTIEEDPNNGNLDLEAYNPAAMRVPRPEYELYDLVADPREQTNLAGKGSPEEDALRAELDAWMERTGDMMPTLFASYHDESIPQKQKEFFARWG